MTRRLLTLVPALSLVACIAASVVWTVNHRQPGVGPAPERGRTAGYGVPTTRAAPVRLRGGRDALPAAGSPAHESLEGVLRGSHAVRLAYHDHAINGFTVTLRVKSDGAADTWRALRDALRVLRASDVSWEYVDLRAEDDHPGDTTRAVLSVRYFRETVRAPGFERADGPDLLLRSDGYVAVPESATGRALAGAGRAYQKPTRRGSAELGYRRR